MKLAISGGGQVRVKPFMNRPMVDDCEKQVLLDCLDKSFYSRFVGSPVGNYKNELKLPSKSANELGSFWSVLGGKYVREFEANFSIKHNVNYSVSSNSATSSIISSIISLGLKPGDEVITTPFSFTATATAIRIAGVKVVFADICPKTFCLTAENVEKRINKNTKAVVAVHLLGNDADIINIKNLCNDKSLYLIEDSAQAVYTKVHDKFLGTFGEIGVFSFQESKNMMTGEGGMAITNFEDLAYKLRLVRNHGESMVFEDQDSQDILEAAVGYNFRLPEPLAALGLEQCKKLDKIKDIRSSNYNYLVDKIQKFDFLSVQHISNYITQINPYCLGLRFKHSKVHRNTFAAALRAEGVPVSTGFPRLLNENYYTKEDISYTPVAKELNENSYLGIFQIGHPNTKEDMDDIVVAIEKIAENISELEIINSKHLGKREYTLGR